MAITPRAIQDLLDQLEASRQSRRRAWEVLQRLRAILDEFGPDLVPPPANRSFEAEGAILEKSLRKSLRENRSALSNLAEAVRRFREAMFKPESKRDYPQALQALLRALETAEQLDSSQSIKRRERWERLSGGR
jgi:hypothetical protein